MVGMLLWKAPERGKRSVFVRERSILHTRFLCAEVARGPKTPEAVARRRMAAAIRRLRKQGVTQAVLPEGFAYGELLDRGGVHGVSTLPLRRAIAADYVRWSLRERDIPAAGARVAVCAAALTGDVVRTVTELALRHGDYVPDGTGGVVRAEGAEAVLEQVRFRLTARRGAFPLQLPREWTILVRERGDGFVFLRRCGGASPPRRRAYPGAGDAKGGRCGKDLLLYPSGDFRSGHPCPRRPG